MILSYLLKRLRRHISVAFLSLLIVAIVVMLLLGLSHYRESQQEKLDAVYEDFEIRCTLTNVSGARTTDLNISDSYVGLFDGESGKLSAYAKDVFLLRSLRNATLREAADIDPALAENVAFYMTNDPESSAYLEGAVIQYAQDYVSESFGGDESICILNEKLTSYVSEAGTVYLYTPWGEMEARVVGTFLGDEPTVFVPWQIWNDQLIASGQARKATAMAFTLADNHLLGEAKSALRDYFIPASRINKASNMHGLIIDDSLFIDTVVVLERSLALMRVVQVMVYVLSVGISFLVAYLGIRGRRLELAVMRSMGTRSLAIYAEVLSEHIQFFVMGASVACLLGVLLGLSMTQSILSTVGVFMICYLIGVALAVAQATSGQIMQILKGKE